jgi:hypothetical protein
MVNKTEHKMKKVIHIFSQDFELRIQKCFQQSHTSRSFACLLVADPALVLLTLSTRLRHFSMLISRGGEFLCFHIS